MWLAWLPILILLRYLIPRHFHLRLRLFIILISGRIKSAYENLIAVNCSMELIRYMFLSSGKYIIYRL